MNRAVAGALIEPLRRVPLFEDLDSTELQSVADSMHEANVPAGAVVTAEGGPGDGFFTTLCGLVRYSIPVIPIAGDGGALFQPISIDDVVRCIVLSLERGPAMSTIEIGGPEVLTYEGIVDIIHDAIGAGMRIKVHVPVPALMPVAAVMDKVLPNPPVTPAQLRMLARNNITRIDAVPHGFGFAPAAFSDNAGYLNER